MKELTIQEKIIEELVSKDQLCLDIKELVEKRAIFVKDYLEQNRMNNLVLGISGGIDSLVAGLICNYINQISEYKIKLHLISLPYGTQKDMDDVILSVDIIKPYCFKTYDIYNIANSFYNEYKKDISKTIAGNVHARARMILQYMYAQDVNGLVVGTDHAGEALTGFFTKYGDGGTDINPLSGLKKSTIYKIAKWFDVPNKLIEKAPAAGLGISETDEDELGISYQNIDDFLSNKQIEEKAFERIVKLYNNSKHKRQMPISPKFKKFKR